MAYFVDERITNSAFKTVKSYYQSSLTLRTEWTQFSSLPIGISKTYDETGNIIMVQDYDALCPFSVGMLIDKFKEEYNIDLSFQKDIVEIKSKYFSHREEHPPLTNELYSTNGIKDVMRSSVNGKPAYDINMLLSDDYPRRIITIDGITGKLISDDINIYPYIK